MNEIEIVINGKKLYLDFDLYQRELQYKEKKEQEYWDWVFSGQRTIDMFGIEGAKRILEIQEENDRRRYK